MDSCVRDVVILAPGEAADSNGFVLLHTGTRHIHVRVVSHAQTAAAPRSFKFTAPLLFMHERFVSVRSRVPPMPHAVTNVTHCYKCYPDARVPALQINKKQSRLLPQIHTYFYEIMHKCVCVCVCVCARALVPVLSALRAFLSRYENLFTAPCCVCGDLL